jgi:uncharacterized protein YecT (DUF1311 family)
MVRISYTIRFGEILLGFCILLITQDVKAQQSDQCLDMRSQNEMNTCEAERYQKADTDLNQAYRELISKHKSEALFLEKLKLAQQSWVKFRDAYVESIYYQKDKLQAYGSVYPTCKAILLTRLTIERTRELRQMLNPAEGDVCGFAASESSLSR